MNIIHKHSKVGRIKGTVGNFFPGSNKKMKKSFNLFYFKFAVLKFVISLSVHLLWYLLTKVT